MIWRQNKNLDIGDRELPKPVYIQLKTVKVAAGILQLEIFFGGTGALKNGHQRTYTRNAVPQSLKDYIVGKIEQLPQFAGAVRTGQVWHQAGALELNGRQITGAYAKVGMVMVDFESDELFVDMIFSQSADFGIVEISRFHKDRVPLQVRDYFLAELAALPQMAGAELVG